MRPLILFCITLLISACSGGDGPQLQPLTGNAVILAFGDSLTYGTGASAEQSYPALLEKLGGRAVVNSGIPGETTAGGLARLPEELEEYQPQLLILCLGGNDMLRRVPAQQTRDNLQRMIAISQQRGIPVLLLGVPEFSLLGLDSAEYYEEIASQMNIPIEADIIPQLLSEDALKSDKIHPNAEGYRHMAEAILEKLQQAGAL